MKKGKLKKIFEKISPILIKPKPTSITISLSRRFFIFNLMNKLKKNIEDDPYLNFISVLKNYKVLGRILNGTIRELHRDRNKSYFRNFFINKELYEMVKSDLEWVYERNKDLKLTITKRGIIIYDNYKKNEFNVLLMTVHSGRWMPKDIEKKQTLSEKERLLEEDIDIHKIYGPIVLEKGGIWIDNKFSRFACDFNRSREKAIYDNNSEEWIDEIWKDPLTENQRERLMEGYNEFYFTLKNLVNSYRFNIIFDGHSMKDGDGRPEISFATDFIPKFYMPIVRSMQRKMINMDYGPVLFNTPYTGGYILEWLSEKFPDLFIFSIEVNKKLYMNKSRKKVYKRKLKKLSEDLTQIFDIEVEE